MSCFFIIIKPYCVPKCDIEDLNLLFKSFDCTQLMQENCTQKNASSKLVLTLDKESRIGFSASNSSQFSTECATKIMELYQGNRDLFRIKEIIESYKLKVETVL